MKKCSHARIREFEIRPHVLSTASRLGWIRVPACNPEGNWLSIRGGEVRGGDGSRILQFGDRPRTHAGLKARSYRQKTQLLQQA